MIFYPESVLMIPSHDASPGYPQPEYLQMYCNYFYNTTIWTLIKRYIISLTMISSLSCFDCLRAVQCTRTQGNRERVQHSKLIDFYITMPRGAKRTFQRAWTPNPQRHHRHVNCDARRISAFTGHGVNRILHKLLCKRAQKF